MRVDENIVQAINSWVKYGLDPGSCTRLLLEGKYNEAYLHAHPLIKPYWSDHVAYVKSLPLECRGKNMQIWKKKKDKERRIK